MMNVNVGAPNMSGRICQSIFLLNFLPSSDVRVMSPVVTRTAAVSSVYAAAWGLETSFSSLEMDCFCSIISGAMMEKGREWLESGRNSCEVYKGTRKYVSTRTDITARGGRTCKKQISKRGGNTRRTGSTIGNCWIGKPDNLSIQIGACGVHCRCGI